MALFQIGLFIFLNRWPDDLQVSYGSAYETITIHMMWICCECLKPIHKLHNVWHLLALRICQNQSLSIHVNSVTGMNSQYLHLTCPWMYSIESNSFIANDRADRFNASGMLFGTPRPEGWAETLHKCVMWASNVDCPILIILVACREPSRRRWSGPVGHY